MFTNKHNFHYSEYFGIILVDIMESSGYITPLDITSLLKALRKLGLPWIATSVQRLYKETVGKENVGYRSKQIIEGNVEMLLFAKVTSSISKKE